MGVFLESGDDELVRLEKAFSLTVEMEPISNKLQRAHVHDLRAALDGGLITEVESERMVAMREAVAAIVDVDDFAATALTPERAKAKARRQDVNRDNAP